MNPPSCNTGGNNPPTKPSKTNLDWFAFTYQDTGEFHEKHVRREKILDFLPGCRLGETERGHNGYDNERKIFIGTVIVGWMNYGASTHDRTLVVITGEGLRLRRFKDLQDEGLQKIQDVFPEARISRIDVALDLYEGEFTPSDAARAYEQGEFDNPPALRRPYSQWVGTKENGEDEAATFYVGKRKSKKLLRVYMKGLQIMRNIDPLKLAEMKAEGIISDWMPDNPEEMVPWVRLEMEWGHDKKKPLSFDMIGKRDDYFSGAYPWLARVMDSTTAAKPKYLPKEPEVEVAHLIKACKASYGGLIFHLSEELGYSPEKIVQLLKGEKTAARIKTYAEGIDSYDCLF
tara:strand:+ start:4379 stop:5413 length:1035 start_codon:yes stop_codon:yes gene_type:complete